MKTTEIYADFHIHTHISPCGKPQATVQAMIQRASEKGVAALGFADHYTPHPIPGCAFYNTQRIDILTQLRGELAGIEYHGSMDVLVGIEADYTLAGAGCLDDAVLRSTDHIICAASHFHLPAAPVPDADTPQAKAVLIIRMTQEMLGVPGVSVWAHPFDCGSMRPLGPILATVSENTLAGLITLANRQKVAIEINGGAGQYPAYQEAATPFFLLAREMGARFTLTADAHHPDDLERLDIALDWALAMGFHQHDFMASGELRERQQNKVEKYFSEMGHGNSWD